MMAALAALGSVITTPAAHASAHDVPTHTLTVTATNLAGKPDNGDLVWAYDADSFNAFSSGNPGIFHNGVVKFNVPSGHYWVVSQFFDFSSSPPAAQFIDVPPQFMVSGNTIVHVTPKAATSQVTMTTPRHAMLQDTKFNLVLGDRSGTTRGLQVVADNASQSKAIWISTLTRKPAVGTLQAFAGALLTSPPGTAGTPYAYNLDLKDPAGIIPAQHYTIQPTSLATVTDLYYQDVPTDGQWATEGGYAAELALAGKFLPALFGRHLSLPGALVQYFSAAPDLYWNSSYLEVTGHDASWEQFDNAWHVLAPGEHQIVDWNRFPLHPQSDYSSGGVAADQFPTLISASRTGNTLSLNVSPFSDNQPGHLGGNFEPGLTASYTIDQNGKPLAHGNWLGGIPPVTLSTRPSMIGFTLNAARTGTDPAYPLSAASHTTWTWRSAPAPGSTVPQAFYCSTSPTGQPVRQCAAQPMMTLDYHVNGMALNGTVPPGYQQISLHVGYIQLSATSHVTPATAQVSCDDGKTWRQAAAKPAGNGNFTITFTERAICTITLRVHAADTTGGSISETITRAYKIGA